MKVKDGTWDTTFKIVCVLYQWLEMNFGLCDAPMTFVYLVNDERHPSLD
jgi:hypothetical protein